MRVHKITDRIKVSYKIDKETLAFELSPLTWEQKSEITSLFSMAGAKSKMDGTKLAIKYGLKSITGLENEDGTPYVLEFEDGVLKDSSLDVVSNINDKDGVLLSMCVGLINPQGLDQTELIGSDGKAIKGVKIEASGSKKQKA